LHVDDVGSVDTAAMKVVCVRFASVKFTVSIEAPVTVAPVRSARVKFAPTRSTRGSSVEPS
jgi:hypothetical protein